MLDKTSGKFIYKGAIPASKSLLNRALIAQSLSPKLEVIGSSSCDDVQNMIQGLKNFKTKLEVDCGDAGTVLRFLAFRIAREEGRFLLKGSRRLFERPHQDLLYVLNQLQVHTEFDLKGLVIQSQGWKKPLKPIKVPREKSSQYATGLLMSCWGLPFDVDFYLSPPGLKDSYWEMSVAFAETLGMQIEKGPKDKYKIAAHQKITLDKIEIEPDYSSAFAIAAAAAIDGEVRIEKVGAKSLQPDYGFIEIMQKMRIPILLEKTTLGVLKAPRILPVDVSMAEIPDLFPIMAVLCAFAEGTSRLHGAPRLVYKESDRIKKTAELLQMMKVECETKEDGLVIKGQGRKITPTSFEFDSDSDHRMAMAAGLLIRTGWNVKLKNPKVVNKSFPGFWDVIGIRL